VSAPRPNATSGRLRAALALESFDGRAAQRLMEPRDRGRRADAEPPTRPREAAALLYVFCRDDALLLPLTLRAASLREHGGQVSLPGGRPEGGETLRQTAWREAAEEVGLAEEGAETLGVLAPVAIPITHTRLHVHVALGPDPGLLHPQAGEVAKVVLASLDDLTDPARRGSSAVGIRGRAMEVPCFDLAGLRVWGATAMALSDLAERLRAVSGPRAAR